MQVEIGSQDSIRGTSRHDDGRTMDDPASETRMQSQSQRGSVRSSTDEPLPACSAAKGGLAAYCSSLLRTYVDVKLSEPPRASHGEIQSITERLAAALPAALAAAQLGAAWRYTRAATAGLASSSGALGVTGATAAAAAAACLLSHATRTVTHAAALGGTFQLVFEVVEATVPALPATPADAVAAAAVGAALPALLLETAAEQQQQVEAVEQALQQALAAALLPGWGIKSVQLDPQVQAQQQQQQQQQQRSLQDEVVVALAAAAQGLALRPATVGLPSTPASAAAGSGSSGRGIGHTAVDEVSVAIELLLPAHSVQQLLAAGQESLRAVVLSCTPGRLLGHLLLDKAWMLQHDGDEEVGAEHQDAAAAATEGDTDVDSIGADTSGIEGAAAAAVAAAAAAYDKSAGARRLQMQLRIIREKPQQQQQQEEGGRAGSSVRAAGLSASALKIDNDEGDDAEARSASCLSECQVLSVVLMTAPAAAEPAMDQPQERPKQAASLIAAAASAIESSESGEGDVMLAQLPLLVLPSGAQAELQRQFAAAAAAGVPYAAMYRQLLPLLQDWELLLTLYGLSSDGRSSGDGAAGDGGGGDGDGDGVASTEGGGVDWSSDRRVASGSAPADGGGSRPAATFAGGDASSKDSSSSDGQNSGDGGSDGSAIDVGQLKAAAAAALAAYFAAHRMPECLQLVQAIAQQLEL